ncbi:G-type lectin S-receptor-like serine/threonine-protein kinase RLK1 [Pyrus ussuriensis x Pyrus communis]|uniref:G-type lectin S-receptor-like serine/threonine-protein kinase RLK1 n=1 Tax=Pyrus ussuriensis x Pyrus communis TaxID=2448454 RepID=A0A5N5FWB7_9ROSA|nr:G-type lectin S-receptor-like serine/threonine-protein kinase RLK1 [Pyrus ussuriensis x Pyrus communis]
MSLGSSLTARNDNSASWQSPSGEFAFGFRQIGNDGFLLAIWFNKVPDKTVVWSANGNSLVVQGSKGELTAVGLLLLNDIATGKDTLVASVGTGVVTYAAMLDTGNFVLANAHSNSLWESCGHPTDTILPAQTINQCSRLYAPYTSTNYLMGRFLLTLESDGNLKLSTTNFPQDYPYYGYWNYTDTLHSGFQVIFNQSGSVVLPYTFSNQDLYQRATLDYDGVLRYYVFRRSNDSSGGTWSALSFIPSNICMSIVQKQGGRACGFNSLCNQNQGRPICQCPSGYTLMDPHDALKGCKPNFVPHSCDGASSESDLFYMQEMQNANCQASQYDEFYGAIPLLNGRIDPSYNGKAFIKIRKDNSTLGSAGAAKTKRKKEYDSTLIVAGSVLLSSLGGTKGYVAPEWFKNLPITGKVDVYSFGILSLEIICCRKKFEENAEDENQMILADWAYDSHKQYKLHLLFPNDSEPMEAIKEMEKYVMIAMRCIEEDPLLRPTMKNVTLMLEGAVEVSFPPDPSSFINSTF